MATLTQDLGLVTAYGYAKAGGYTGTEAQFKALLAGVETYYNGSQTAASNAAASAAAAQRSADNAFSGTPAGYDKVANIANANNLNGASTRAGWITLQAGTDLNTLIQPGVYTASASAMPDIENAPPTTSAIRLVVENTYGNNNYKQSAVVAISQNRGWYRWTSNGGQTWSAWQNETSMSGQISSLSSDTEIINLPAGAYMVSVQSNEAGYVPHQYGTILIMQTGTTYMSALLLATNGKAYFRVGNTSSKTWYTNWLQLQTVS